MFPLQFLFVIFPMFLFVLFTFLLEAFHLFLSPLVFIRRRAGPAALFLLLLCGLLVTR